MGSTVMKVNELLNNTQRLFIETAPLIYSVEINPNYAARMDAVIEAVKDGAIETYSSVLTLIEVLVHTLKEANNALA